jgi:hypothetical protein
LLAAVAASAGVYKAQKQALAEAFPGGGIERKTVFLTPEQVRSVEKRARARVESRVVSYYVGLLAEGRPAGTAYFDTHLVRSMPETLFILVDPQGKLGRVEILAFHEPEDYKLGEGWLGRLSGKALDDDLAPGRALVRVTGATLSTEALAAAVRRTLALHELVTGAAQP